MAEQCSALRLLRHLAAEAGFVQFGENGGGTEIAGDFKRGGVFGGGIFFNARHFLQRGVDGFGALPATKMDAGNFHGLDLGIFRAGFVGDLDGSIAGFTEITGLNEGINCLLDGGLIGGGDGDGAAVLVALGAGAGHTGDGLVHAFDALIAAKMDVAEFDSGFGGLR